MSFRLKPTYKRDVCLITITTVFGSNSAALCERYPLPTTTPSLVPNPINTLHTLYFFLQIHSPIDIKKKKKIHSPIPIPIHSLSLPSSTSQSSASSFSLWYI
ncbi:hypothetical protein P8452_27046 [Trifolium repens]|nr:hypothetical protein P8452_27046 [Trifolium repens]